MVIDVWKVRVVRGYESTFEQLCKTKYAYQTTSKHKKGNYQVVDLKKHCWISACLSHPLKKCLLASCTRERPFVSFQKLNPS